MYVVELACSVLYMVTFGVDLIVKGTLDISGDKIYGYTIVVDIVGMVSWLFSLLLVYREKVHIVMRRPHGWTLMLFWVTSVLYLGLSILSYHHKSWWWHLASGADVADLVLYVVRCVSVTVLVVLGLVLPSCWPGHRPSYSLLINTEVRVDVDNDDNFQERRRKEGDFIKTRTTSAFANILAKAKLLFPYIWPKGW